MSMPNEFVIEVAPGIALALVVDGQQEEEEREEGGKSFLLGATGSLQTISDSEGSVKGLNIKNFTGSISCSIIRKETGSCLDSNCIKRENAGDGTESSIMILDEEDDKVGNLTEAINIALKEAMTSLDAAIMLDNAIGVDGINY